MNILPKNKWLLNMFLSLCMFIIFSSWVKEAGIVFKSDEAHCKISFPVQFETGIDSIEGDRRIWAEASYDDVFYRIEARFLMRDLYKSPISAPQALMQFAQKMDGEVTQQQRVKVGNVLAVDAIVNAYNSRQTAYLRILDKTDFLYTLIVEVPREKATEKLATTFFSTFKTTR